MASKQVLPFSEIPEKGTFVGADPDSHNISLVYLVKGLVPQITLIKVPAKVKARQCAPELAKICVKLGAIEGPAKLSGLAVVEAMDVQYSGKTNQARVQNVADLNITGGAIAFILAGCCGIETTLALPGEWKGQVPKDIHQARICVAMGWKYEKSGTSIWPVDAQYNCTRASAKGVVENHVLGKTEWKHVLDSIGLALFAAKTHLKNHPLKAKV